MLNDPGCRFSVTQRDASETVAACGLVNYPGGSVKSRQPGSKSSRHKQTIGRERAKPPRERPIHLLHEVRKNPREPAQTRGSRRTKKANRLGLAFSVWWSWRDLNPRPQAFFEQIYMFSGLI